MGHLVLSLSVLDLLSKSEVVNLYALSQIQQARLVGDKTPGAMEGEVAIKKVLQDKRFKVS